MPGSFCFHASLAGRNRQSIRYPCLTAHPHSTSHSLPAEIPHPPIHPLPNSFSPLKPAGKPQQLHFCPWDKPISNVQWPQHFTFQSGGSWAPNPRAGNILSLKEKKKSCECVYTHRAGLLGSHYGLPVLPAAPSPAPVEVAASPPPQTVQCPLKS